MNKLCWTCNLMVESSSFVSSTRCKKCHSQYQKQYREKNKEKVKKWQAKADTKYRKTDKFKKLTKKLNDNKKEYYQDYYENNKSKYRLRDKKWAKENKGKIAHKSAKRRAHKLKATISGFEKELKEIYENCPKGQHVDHIIPLQNEIVCGLHVPWNLQYLTAKENLKKSNGLENLT